MRTLGFPIIAYHTHTPHPEVSGQLPGYGLGVDGDPGKVVPLVDGVVGEALVVGEGHHALAGAQGEDLGGAGGVLDEDWWQSLEILCSTTRMRGNFETWF